MELFRKKHESTISKNYNITTKDIGNIVEVFSIENIGSKQNIKKFTGTIIATKQLNNKVNASITVKTSGKFFVIKQFPIYGNIVTNIKIISQKKVRRAKLYYLTRLNGKNIRLKDIKTPKTVKPTNTINNSEVKEKN